MEAEDGGRYEVLAGFVLAQHIDHLASFCKNVPHLACQPYPSAFRPLISWLVARL